MSIYSSPAREAVDVSVALRRLRDAEDEHNFVRRGHCAGVTEAALASDLGRWERLGEAVAGLAVAVYRHCAQSDFCDARPDIGLLTARLSESFDDLMDGPAWAVVDAAARLAAASRDQG